jgi:hypothetical protein
MICQVVLCGKIMKIGIHFKQELFLLVASCLESEN